MQVLMMGTGPFAVPSLQAVHAGRHDVVGVVTRPRAGRRREPSPVERAAEALSLPVWAPSDINAAESRAKLADYGAELFLVCDYGQILSDETLGVAPRGGVNLHGSLLPKYRGAAPVQWAVFHGETVTGVTVIQMTAGLDAGPCLGRRELEIGRDETAGELEPRLAKVGATLVCEVLDELERGNSEVVAQLGADATKAPRLKKTDGEVDWSRSAESIRNQIRAMDPWPKAYTHWLRAGDAPIRLILGAGEPVGGSDAAPGTVLEAAKDRLVVAAGGGGFQVMQLQPAGKRMVDVAAFLRGNRVEVGDRFGPVDAT